MAAEVLGVAADLCSGSLVQHGPAARRRRYMRALAGAVVLIAVIDVGVWATRAPSWTLIASLAALPVAAMIAADRYRSLGHRLSEGWLVTAMGSLSRRRQIIGTDAIIGWRIHQTWFQRRKGLITLTATTAAGHQQYSVRDVPALCGLAVAEAATGDLVRPFLAPVAPGQQRS